MRLETNRRRFGHRFDVLLPSRYSPRTFISVKMFFARLPSSTKASGDTCFIRLSFSTRRPAF
jgi:hypothetical protein